MVLGFDIQIVFLGKVEIIYPKTPSVLVQEIYLPEAFMYFRKEATALNPTNIKTQGKRKEDSTISFLDCILY